MSASRASDEFKNEKLKVELTPMIDVAFLILIFFMCLPFKTLDGKLAAFRIDLKTGGLKRFATYEVGGKPCERAQEKPNC